jgi:CheY-like chemotaxis protein
VARVLIVEDYPNLQMLYKKALEAEGYEVTTARDGEQALAAFDRQEPDLILLDLLLPNKGGLEVLRALNVQKYSHMKVIVFSNMASPELYAEAKELGASEYLLKAKYTPKQIAEVVTKTLN